MSNAARRDAPPAIYVTHHASRGLGPLGQPREVGEHLFPVRNGPLRKWPGGFVEGQAALRPRLPPRTDALHAGLEALEAHCLLRANMIVLPAHRCHRHHLAAIKLSAPIHQFQQMSRPDLSRTAAPLESTVFIRPRRRIRRGRQL
jgi:hypothetical protein